MPKRTDIHKILIIGSGPLWPLVAWILWQGATMVHAQTNQGVLDETARSILLTPTSVKAFRVESQKAFGDLIGGPIGASGQVEGYPVIAGPVAVDPQVADNLGALLTSDDAYGRVQNLCLFSPGVAIQFEKGHERINALLCFQCDDLAVIRQGHTVRSGNFGAIRGDLVMLVKRLFPEDSEIQALSLQGSVAK